MAGTMAYDGLGLGFAALLLAAGLAAGFLGGLIGAGGGLIVVPVLYHAFSAWGVDAAIRMPLVVGTALAAVVPTALLGARSHWRRGNVDTAIARRLALPVLLGAVLAGSLSGRINGSLLCLAFALVATVVSVNLARKTALTLGHGLPGAWGTGLIGAGIGFASTLVGIGGSTLAVPLLHALRMPMRTAVGTASVLGLLIGLPGAVAFMVTGWGDPRVPAGCVGYVNLAAVALIFPASTVAISFGARFTGVLNERVLRALFALFLALTAFKMISALS